MPSGEPPASLTEDDAQLSEQLSMHSRTRVAFEDGTVHELFARMAARHPEALALVDCGDPSTTLTYAQLDACTSRLAVTIRSLGCWRLLPSGQHVVALCLARSIEMVVAVFGTLKSGAAYLPIEPSTPATRASEMVEDASCDACLLQNNGLATLFAGSTAPLLVVDQAGSLHPLSDNGENVVLRQQRALTALPASNSSAVYVMYTSGSTGKPKGVVVPHGPLLMRVSWLQRAFGIGVGELVPLKTEYVFGVSEWELFWTLTHGATLAVVPPATVKKPIAFAKSLHAMQASVVFLIPTQVDMLLGSLSQLPAKALPALRHIVCCGEPLKLQTVQNFHARMARHQQIHNVYGPTEASMTWHPCLRGAAVPDAARLSMPIGRAIDNTVVLLLDDDMRLVPNGTEGEICFGGCLAAGYLQGSLTAQRFVLNPYASDMARLGSAVPPAPTLFRTGDRAVSMSDGTLLWVGRRDRQVKVRGHRIELDEIESVVRSAVPSTLKVVVVLQPHAAEIVAYIQADLSESGITGAAAKETVVAACKARLTHYMQPARVEELGEFPTLQSGKIDMARLARGELDGWARPSISNSSRPEQEAAELGVSCFCGACTFTMQLALKPEVAHCSCAECRRTHCAPMSVHLATASAPPEQLKCVRHVSRCNGPLGTTTQLRCAKCHAPVASLPTASGSTSAGPAWIPMSAVIDTQLPYEILRLAGESLASLEEPTMALQQTSASPTTLTSLTCSCSCGATRFTTDLARNELQVNHCYCSICRQLSGSPVFSWTPVRKAAVRCEQGEALQSVDSPAASRSVCGKCGGMLTMQYTDQPETTWLAASALTANGGSTPAFAYAAHIFCKDAAKWSPPPHDELPRMTGFDYGLVARLSRGDYVAPPRQSAPANGTSSSMEAVVMMAVSEVMGETLSEELSPDMALMDAGVDSLGATAIASKLRHVTKLPVPPMLLYEHPSVASIATHLAELHGGTAMPVLPTRTTKPQPIAPPASLHPADSEALPWADGGLTFAGELTLISEGIGQPPDAALKELLAQACDQSVAAKLRDQMFSALRADAETAYLVPPDAEAARAWDGGHPAVQLPTCIALQLLAVHALVTDAIAAGKLPNGWPGLTAHLACITGHSAGFLSAAVLASGVADGEDFLSKATLALRLAVRLGAIVAHQVPESASPEAESCVYLLRDTGATVAEIGAAASRSGASIGLINAPSSVVVVGPPPAASAALDAFVDECNTRSWAAVPLPIRFPVHSPMLNSVRSSLAMSPELATVGEWRVLASCELISPLDGQLVSASVGDALLDVLTIGAINWPLALARIREGRTSRSCEIVHVGSAGVSASFDWADVKNGTFTQVCLRAGGHSYSAWPDLKSAAGALHRSKGQSAPSSASSDGGTLGEVLRKVREVTGLVVQPSDSLLDLGLDSIATGQLMHQLRHVLPLRPADLTGGATLEELVGSAAAQQKAGSPPAVAISFAVVDMLRMPLCVLVMIYHCNASDGRDSLGGAGVAVAFFMSASFAFWQMSYPHGQPIYGRQVRLWICTRLTAVLPMYYVVLAVQQFFYLDFFLARPEWIGPELLNWVGAGVLVGYWVHGNAVIWFLAAQAWLILIFPVVVSTFRLTPGLKITWRQLTLLAALSWGFIPALIWLGAPPYLSHGHPAFWAPMMPLCAAVTLDLSSPEPLLASTWLRQTLVGLFCLWFVMEALILSENDGYALNPYARPIAALTVPLLLQPNVLCSHFEGLISSPVGRSLSALAPYSMGFYLWQGIAAKVVLLVVKGRTARPNGSHWGAVVDVEQSAWKSTLYKLALLAAIAYASLHLVERPLADAIKRALRLNSRSPTLSSAHEMV